MGVLLKGNLNQFVSETRELDSGVAIWDVDDYLLCNIQDFSTIYNRFLSLVINLLISLHSKYSSILWGSGFIPPNFASFRISFLPASFRHFSIRAPLPWWSETCGYKSWSLLFYLMHTVEKTNQTWELITITNYSTNHTYRLLIREQTEKEIKH